MEPDRLEDGIYEICTNNRFGRDFYVRSDVPYKKLAEMAEAMNIPRDERVIAFVDCSKFGSGKLGMVIAAGGLYWKNPWDAPETVNYLSWETFRNLKVDFRGEFEIRLGKGHVFHVTGSSF